MCLASSSFPHLCHKRCTFQLCWHFQCASSKYKLCGTFFHRCYSWTRFFVVFLVVLVESNWTAEFFSTIGKLILNVHGSKSGSQCVKPLRIWEIKKWVPWPPFSAIEIISDRNIWVNIFWQFHFLSNIWVRVETPSQQYKNQFEFWQPCWRMW